MQRVPEGAIGWSSSHVTGIERLISSGCSRAAGDVDVDMASRTVTSIVRVPSDDVAAAASAAPISTLPST